MVYYIFDNLFKRNDVAVGFEGHFHLCCFLTQFGKNVSDPSLLALLRLSLSLSKLGRGSPFPKSCTAADEKIGSPIAKTDHGTVVLFPVQW